MPEGACRFLLALDPIGVSTTDGLIGLQPLDAILLDANMPAAIVSVTERASFYLIDIETV